MKKDIFVYILSINIFILFCLCLETVKIRWQFSQEHENNAYLQVANNKLTEINFNLKTEYHHLSSPAKVERHAKEMLHMVEITKAINITYEK
ncbi:cell division protein FtsL [Pseudomonadota bacterium]|nr:cell division protein FtsL [Pseudomonadota bacterium]MDC0198533.1 cell division protein FtsL [Pseudomonadota bacterium]|tara:strand:+ start:1180 stop:1455 length:276 start_codon:yes stop_codon:yes gene_type:complete